MKAQSTAVTEIATAAMREQWDRTALGWRDAGAVIRLWLRQATQAMLEKAGVKSGDHVLDVAAGAGDQTLDVAERVGSQGYVLATDLSPEILKFAAQHAAASGYRHVETRVSDGQALQVDDALFDAAICRLGLMFFPDPLLGLREMARVLKPGGGVCTMVFGPPEANPCVTTLMSIARSHAGLPPRDPFQPGGLLSLGKPGLIDGLFAEAGFCEVATTRLAAPFLLPSVEDYMTFIRTSAGPIVQIVNGLDAERAEAAWADMERALARYKTPNGWEGPNELLLTSARRQQIDAAIPAGS